MRLFVDYNHQECDPGNLSSAESSDGNSSTYVSNHPSNTMSNSRVARGNSEPPVDYHARTGLRKSGCPFKVSGIVMGSQENLASSDDEKSTSSELQTVFGKRLRRSITPMRQPSKDDGKNYTLPRANIADKNNQSSIEDVPFSTPFGSTQKGRGTSRHAFKGGRKPDVGQWGQPRNNSHDINTLHDEMDMTASTIASSEIKKEITSTSNHIISFVESSANIDRTESSTVNIECESTHCDNSKIATCFELTSNESKQCKLEAHVLSASQEAHSDYKGIENITDFDSNQIDSSMHVSSTDMQHEEIRTSFVNVLSESSQLNLASQLDANVPNINHKGENLANTLLRPRAFSSTKSSLNESNNKGTKPTCNHSNPDPLNASLPNEKLEKLSQSLTTKDFMEKSLTTSKANSISNDISNCNSGSSVEEDNDKNDLESVSSICVEETIILIPSPASNPNTASHPFESRPDTACTMITIGSDVLEVDPDDVKYHGGTNADIGYNADFYDDILEVEPHDVSYHGPKTPMSIFYKDLNKSSNHKYERDKTPTNDDDCTIIPDLISKDTADSISITTNKSKVSIEERELSSSSHTYDGNVVKNCNYKVPNDTFIVVDQQKPQDDTKNKDKNVDYKEAVDAALELGQEKSQEIIKHKVMRQSSNITSESFTHYSNVINEAKSFLIKDPKRCSQPNPPEKELISMSTKKEEKCEEQSRSIDYNVNNRMLKTTLIEGSENCVKTSDEYRKIEKGSLVTSKLPTKESGDNGDQDCFTETLANSAAASSNNNIDSHSFAQNVNDKMPKTTLIEGTENGVKSSDEYHRVEKDSLETSKLPIKESGDSGDQGCVTETLSNSAAVSSNSNNDSSSFVMCKKEYAELEKLFDKLIENEGLEYDEFKELLKNNKEGENIFEIESPQKTILNSNTEDSILSILRSNSVCNVDESVLNDGDISSAEGKDDETSLHSETSSSLRAESIKVRRKKSTKPVDSYPTQDESDVEESTATVISDVAPNHSQGKIRNRVRRKSSEITPSSVTDKHRAKRRRNRTIDNPEQWCSTVATYTVKTYTKEELKSDVVRLPHTKEETGCQTQPQTDNESGTEEGLGQGFGIIINKLKNIETKLDELKTIDNIEEGNHGNHSIIYEDDLPLGMEASVTCLNNCFSQDAGNVSQIEFTQRPQVGISPTCSRPNNAERGNASTLSLDFLVEEEDHLGEKQMQQNKEEASSFFSTTATTEHDTSSSMAHYVYDEKDAITKIATDDNSVIKNENEVDNANDKEDSDDEDRTLIVDEDNVAEHHEDDYVTELPNDDNYNSRNYNKSTPENVLVQSPSPDFPSRQKLDSNDSDGSKLKYSNNSLLANKTHTLDIVSVPPSDMSDLDEDEDLEARSSSRASRIEELAKKMLEEPEMKKEISSSNRLRRPSDPGVKNIMDILGELDTVSERSEIEEDATIHENDEDSESLSDSSQKNQASYDRFCKKKERLREQQRELERQGASHREGSANSSSKRPLRTRSASRERTLGKIKYCWRCHQAGHESYECTVELNPAAWCPRCLESSHWEDSCWLTDKEVCILIKGF